MSTMNRWAGKFLVTLGVGLGMAAAANARFESAHPEPLQSRPAELQLAQAYTELITNTLYQHYTLGYPAPVLTSGVSDRQAGRIQVALVRRLRDDLGPVVGYKAALTNPVAQQQFGVTQPLLGFFLKDMLLDNGATLPAQFGARPVGEGDLMVRVSSEAINEAETNLEFLAALDVVYPFIELPDLIYQPEAILDARALVAVNVGARYGVLGNPIPLEATPEWETRLGQIRVQMVNGAGQTIAAGESSALLGHPLNAVRWLRDVLKNQGVALQPGDLLSLGTITPPMPVEAGSTLRARYFGLTAAPSVEVTVSFDAPE